jgi:hypothetical protein
VQHFNLRVRDGDAEIEMEVILNLARVSAAQIGKTLLSKNGKAEFANGVLTIRKV